MAAPQREVVHAQDLGSGGRLRVGQGPDQPDQRHPAHRRGESAGQASTGPSAQRQPDRLQDLAEADAVTPVADGQPGNLLGEGRLDAVEVAAPKPQNTQVDDGFLVADGRVAQPTLVAAVHPAGNRPTSWTRCL